MTDLTQQGICFDGKPCFLVSYDKSMLTVEHKKKKKLYIKLPRKIKSVFFEPQNIEDKVLFSGERRYELIFPMTGSLENQALLRALPKKKAAAYFICMASSYLQANTWFPVSLQTASLAESALLVIIHKTFSLLCRFCFTPHIHTWEECLREASALFFGFNFNTLAHVFIPFFK